MRQGMLRDPTDDERRRFRLAYNRTHGAVRLLRERAATAREAAREADRDGEAMFAASLRGKAKGYDEAADVIDALDHDRRLPRYGRARA